MVGLGHPTDGDPVEDLLAEVSRRWGFELGADTLLDDVSGLDSLALVELASVVEEITGAPFDLVLDGLAGPGATVRTLVARCTPDGSSGHGRGGRAIGLRPVHEGDLVWIRQLGAHPVSSHRWRLRGMVPTPLDFPSLALPRSLAAMVAVRGDEEVLGLVADYNADLQSRRVYVSLLFRDDVGAGVVLRSVQAYVQHLLDNWPFRKVLLEVPEFNGQTLSLGETSLFQHEAVLKEHEYWRGRYWDLRILSVTRARWSAKFPTAVDADGP